MIETKKHVMRCRFCGQEFSEYYRDKKGMMVEGFERLRLYVRTEHPMEYRAITQYLKTIPGLEYYREAA